jgi:hypothetical protein
MSGGVYGAHGSDRGISMLVTLITGVLGTVTGAVGSIVSQVSTFLGGLL